MSVNPLIDLRAWQTILDGANAIESLDRDSIDFYAVAARKIIQTVENYAPSVGVRAVIQPWAPSGSVLGVEITDLFADTPGAGAGTLVMNAAAELADSASLPIYLRPSSARNREFYARFGFVSDKRNYGFLARLPMIELDDDGDIIRKYAGGQVEGLDDSNPAVRFSLAEPAISPLQRAVDAESAMRAQPHEVIDAEAYFAATEAFIDARTALASEYALVPDAQFGLSAQTSDGRRLSLTLSAQRPGHYQLTRFDRQGEPFGDTQLPTKLSALQEFLSEADLVTVTDSEIAFSRSDLWRSELADRLKLVPMNSAPPAGWLSFINGLQSKGVKHDEIEWSGVRDWLALQPGKVSRHQVLDYLAGNGVLVTESLLGGPDEAAQRAAHSTLVDGIAKDLFGQLRALGSTITIKDTQYWDDEIGWALLDGDVLPADLPLPMQGIAAQWATESKRSLDFKAMVSLATHYDGYQLQGGKNYREILLTLPLAPADPRIELEQKRKRLAAMLDLEKEFAGQGNVERAQTFGEKAAALRTSLNELAKTPLSRHQADFQSNHWPQKNVLAHIRFNERVDAEGKRVLFVEEIQSDWAQQGKRNGFVFQPLTTLPAGYAIEPIRSGSTRMTVRDEKTGVEVTPGGKTTREEAIAWALEEINASGASRHPYGATNPIAPFVQTTDAWVSLAIKRIIKLAADENFDKVAFISGGQSAARYDLGKQVRELRIFRFKDGKYGAHSTPAGEPVNYINQVTPRGGVDASKLAGYIGKDLTDKAISDLEGKPLSTDPADFPSVVYSGLALSVGGDGMKVFYDTIVPRVTRDLLKKLGGGPLSKVTVGEATKLADDRVEEIENLDGSGFHYLAYGINGARVGSAYETREDAIAAAGMGPSEQFSFDITPTLHELAAQGMPLFSKTSPIATFAPARVPSTLARVQAAVSALIGGEYLPNQLGRVVVASAAEIQSTWEPLIGRNVKLTSSGQAGDAQAFFDPVTNTAFLIFDRIAQGSETAVLSHELMHKHGQAVLGEAGWTHLHDVLTGWKDAPAGSNEQMVYAYASRKVAEAGPNQSSREMFPYAVEAAFNLGIKPALAARSGSVANWLAAVKTSMQRVWTALTSKPDTFKAQDLVDLAFGIAQMENPQHAVALDGALMKDGFTEQAIVEKLQAQLKLSEAKLDPLRKLKIYGGPQWDAVLHESGALRMELFALTGDYYGKPKVKLVRPSDDALQAEYASPSEVPADVRRWVHKNSALLTSDATDAVRWGRIAGTLRDSRYPAGELTIYRALADGDEIRPGDWVTTEREYAEQHLSRYLNGNGQILQESVDGRDVLQSPTGNAEEAIYAPREFSAAVPQDDNSGTPGDADEVAFSVSTSTSPLAALKRYWSSRTWVDAADARAHIKRIILEDNARYPMFPAQEESLADQLEFTWAAGGKVKIKVNRSIDRPLFANPIGQDGPQGSTPEVSWDALDLADKGTPASILNVYGRNDKGRVYQAWIETSDLPTPKGEDITEGRLDDDSGARQELSFRGAPPPLKVRVSARGKIDLLDGNHRLAWWREAGHDSVPAYVIDERPAPDNDSSIAYSRADSPLQSWFGASKVVDADGAPLVVYHGTKASFVDFDLDFPGDLGFHFGAPRQANHFAKGKGSRVIPVVLSLQNPLRLRDTFDKKVTSAQNTLWNLEQKNVIDKEQAQDLLALSRSNYALGDAGLSKTWAAIREAIQAAGYDGVVYDNENVKEGRGDCYIAFAPEQIRTALGHPEPLNIDHQVDSDSPIAKVEEIDAEVPCP